MNWWEGPIVWYRLTLFTEKIIEKICFILKVTSLLLTNIAGITGTFLSLAKALIIEQYVFDEVLNVHSKHSYIFLLLDLMQ